ncbi:hypothetical protein V6Z11_D12G273800 [Gossypium hirsutum]
MLLEHQILLLALPRLLFLECQILLLAFPTLLLLDHLLLLHSALGLALLLANQHQHLPVVLLEQLQLEHRVLLHLDSQLLGLNVGEEELLLTRLQLTLIVALVHRCLSQFQLCLFTKIKVMRS